MRRAAVYAWVWACAVAVHMGAALAADPIASVWIDTRLGKPEGTEAGVSEVCAGWARAPEEVQRDGPAGLFQVVRQSLALAAAHRVQAWVIVQDLSLTPDGAGLSQAWCALLVRVPDAHQVAVAAALPGVVAKARGAKAEAGAAAFRAGVPGALGTVHAGVHAGWAVVAFGDGAWEEVTARIAPGVGVFSARVDLNRLRAAAGGAWADADRGPRFLEAVGLANARWFEVSLGEAGAAAAPDGAVPSPRVLTTTLAWSSRSEPPASRRSLVVGESAWPADLPKHGATPEAVMIIRADTLGPSLREGAGWSAWLRSAIEAAGGLCSPATGASLHAWRLKKGEPIRALGSSLGKWCVIQFGAAGAVPGEVRILTPVKSAQNAEKHWSALLADAGRFASQRDRWWGLSAGAAAWLTGGVFLGVTSGASSGTAVLCVHFGAELTQATKPPQVGPP